MKKYTLYKRNGVLTRVVEVDGDRRTELTGRDLPPQADWRAVESALKSVSLKEPEGKA